MQVINLNDNSLLKRRCYVNGEWVKSADGGIITVENPAKNLPMGTVPSLGRNETAEAIGFAKKAWPTWRELTASARGSMLKRWDQLIRDNLEDLAVILTSEQGKPLAEAKSEIIKGCSYISWYAEEGRRAYGQVIPPSGAGRRMLSIRQPVGVVASITPWNFPMSMIARKVAPALAAGCTVVCKPASHTPYSALALAELAHRAGFPPGVFNVITGQASQVGAELTSNPAVRMLGFTGSTSVGKQLMAECAGTVKKLSLELGGNAPFIVFADADLDTAVEGALNCKFRNCGQTCVCTNRFLVEESIHDEFVARLSAKIESLQVGDGLEPGTTQGPLIDQPSLEKIDSLVQASLAMGALAQSGGRRHALGGLFYEPTLLDKARQEMPVCQEEIFGPVAPIVSFNSEDQALDIANDTRYGLASYVFTKDLRRFWRVSEKLEYGMVGVNEVSISSCEAPVGGVKESGLGREGGHQGLDEFMETKYIVLGGVQ
jgi:succinate-semialdehyde dehydrogenase/glutarate-semialdehyde dehydrogenase